jgi:hypothetical protein
MAVHEANIDAVVVAVWQVGGQVLLAGDVGPAALFALLVGLGSWYYLVPSKPSLAVANPVEGLRLSGYFGASFITVAVVGLLQRTRRRLDKSVQALTHVVR